MGHILINDYLHRALFGHNRHGGAILAQSRPRFQPVMQSGAKGRDIPSSQRHKQQITRSGLGIGSQICKQR
jgi:hypothetical protein